MVEKTSKWESELWTYMSSGDGTQCPLRSDCKVRKSGFWCPTDNLAPITRLLDDRQFNPSEWDDWDDFAKGARLCRIFRLVEMLAGELINRGRLRCPPVPIRLIKLADEQHTIEVHLLPLTTYHGAIWHPRGRWIIQLKGDDSSAIQRLTLFHEAFHIIAHCRTTPVFRKRGAIQGSFNELLGDYFAGCVLMPREWVAQKWSEVEDVGRMAEIFDVPRSLMCIRLRELGLI